MKLHTKATTRCATVIPCLLGLALPSAPQAGSDCSSGQVYDDGTHESGYGPVYLGPEGGEMIFLSRFTPPEYPFRYNQVCMYLASPVEGTQFFDVLVFADDGAGNPGAVLGQLSVATELPQPDWYSFSIGCNTSLDQGVAWIGVRFSDPQSSLFLGADDSAGHEARFSIGGAAWDSSYLGFASMTPMIRAAGFAGGAATGSATLRNGSGLNPTCYAAVPPAIGEPWGGNVSHGFYPNAQATRIYFRASPASGVFISAGEVLTDTASGKLFRSTLPATGSSDLHVHTIPNDASLIGITVSSQAAVFGPEGAVLCNAYDLTIGC